MTIVRGAETYDFVCCPLETHSRKTERTLKTPRDLKISLEEKEGRK
jgi:hypothetical protein